MHNAKLKSWTNVDKKAELSGIAERKLKQYQAGLKHKPILYNSAARAGDKPEKSLRTHKSRRSKSNKMKYLYIKEPKVFSLED